MVRESVVEGSKRFWRVNVVKSARRIFTCTQPVARFCARMRAPAPVRQPQHFGVHARVFEQIRGEGFLGADGLLVPSDITARSSMPAGAFAHALRIPSEDGPQHRIRCAAQLSKGMQARRLDPFSELAAEAGQDAAPRADRAARAGFAA
jgi:hypothetical protein